MTMKVDQARLARDWGIVLQAPEFLPQEFRHNFDMAMDAQPTLVTTASGGVPFWLTSYVDPDVVRILQTPNKGAEILGEKKVGDWTLSTYTVPVIENTGEVSSYGDWNTNGRSDANVVWENRQPYLFQTVISYGDRELDVAGAAKLNWVSELQTSAAKTLDKFSDYTYHFGVAGLLNYGILNDPSLSAALTPSTKAAGGTKWVNNGAVVATANEVYGDIQALFSQLVSQTQGLIETTDPMVLVMSPGAQVGLTATNTFGITVSDLLKKSYPNVEFKVSPRYLTQAGNVVQLWAKSFDGHDVGYCAFNEKMRDHQIVRELSNCKQKKTSGTLGAIVKYPMAVAQMLGV